MKSGYRFTLVLSVCLLLLAPIVVAQTTGTIEGTVTDQNGGALPGVTVEIGSPHLQGVRTATTGNDGRYRFASVPPGPYKVTANLLGMSSVQKNATVSLDATATVNIQMQLATRETITVTGEAPVVDVTSTTTGSNYNAKLIEKLPAARNYADIVRAQPGVQDDAGETQGRSLALSIYGATSAENLFIIDGINTTNVIKGFQGKAINGEFVQEVEVKTGGYQAEYGRATGGVINVITKSGGNEFHGDLFGYYNRSNWRSSPTFDKTPEFSQTGDEQFSTTLTNIRRWDAGADLGGFFVKDRLWFFGAYDRVKLDEDVVTNIGLATGVATPFNSISNLYSGKLTFNIAAGSTIVGTFFSDPESRIGNGTQATANADPLTGALLPNTYAARLDVGGQDYAGRFNQLFGSSGVLTLQYARHQDRYETNPLGAFQVRVSDRTNVFTTGDIFDSGGWGEIFGPTDFNRSKRDSYGGSFTAYLQNHEIKVGGDYEKATTDEKTYFSGTTYTRVYSCSSAQGSNRFCPAGAGFPFVNALGENQTVLFRHYFYESSIGSGDRSLDLIPFQAASLPTKNTGLFIQDTWRVIPRLTVNAGLRWDREVMSNYAGFAPFKLTNEWQPRVGFAYDFVGDGSSKIYGSYGRFYYNIPTDLNVRNFSGQDYAITFNYNPNSLVQDPRAYPTLQQGGGDAVEPGTKGPYEDEFTIGVEKALDPTFSIGLKGTYRTLGRTVEDRCDVDYTDPLSLGATCALMNPGGGGTISGGIVRTCDNSSDPTDPNSGSCDLHTAVPAAKRIFRGIEIVARKSFSTSFWAQASLLFSSLKGNYSGAIREADGQTDPGINADYDYAAFLNNAYGKLELDRPVQFRLDAVYTAPFGLAVGLGAYARSGKPISRYGFYNAFYPTELFLDQRGSNGRMPTDYEANLSISYAIRIGAVTVTPQLYVFNLLNRQTVTDQDFGYNTRGGTFCDSSITIANGYAPATVASCSGKPDGTPALDNVDYLKATARTAPRLFRGAIKIAF